jgi:hypothetical protein
MKSFNHTLNLHRPTYNCSVLLVPIQSELTAHGSRYKAAERTWIYSKHLSRDRYPASFLARRSDIQKPHVTWSLCTGVTSPRTWKTQLPLLLRVGPCLQSCCLATHWSNPIQYCHMFGWLRRGFVLVNRFIGSSLIVITNNCDTFKITVITTHTSSSIYFSCKHSAPVSQLSWALLDSPHTDLTLNRYSLYRRRTDDTDNKSCDS